MVSQTLQQGTVFRGLVALEIVPKVLALLGEGQAVFPPFTIKVWSLSL